MSSKKTVSSKPAVKKDIATPKDFRPADLPTKYNNQWFRVIVNFFTIILLGMNFNSIDRSYFSSISIFAFPLFYEYLRFYPFEKSRKVLRKIELFILGLIICICILGFFGFFDIQRMNSIPYLIVQKGFVMLSGAAFPANFIWVVLLISFFVSALDIFVAYIPAAGKEL